MKTITQLFAGLMLIFSSPLCAQHSLNFDGTNDYVSVNASSQFYFTNAMTVEAWINADTWKTLMYKGTVVSMGNNSGGNKGFDLRAAEDGKVEFNLAIGGNWVTATTPAIMQTGQWYHLAGVFTGDSLKVYINGILQAKVPASGTISYSTGKLYIAECPGWTGRTFDGRIDEVRVWNVARTASEIRSSIATELSGSESGLAGYWKFNESSGSTTADATGHGLTGTLTNMTTSSCWTGNFVCTLNDPDAGIGSLIYPVSSFSLGNTEQIRIAINNYSLQPVSNIPVSYSINGGAPVSEICTVSIPALSSYNFTFTQTADLSAYQTYDISIVTSVSGDVNVSNNTMLKSITNFAPGSNFGLAFDGLDDEIVIPNSTGLNPTGALTVEAWINASKWETNIYEGTIIGKVQGEPDRGYNLGVGNNGCAEFQISDNGSWNGAQSGPILETGRWYHLAGVYDGTSVKLYINGVLQNVKTASALNPSTCDLMIGECPSWGGGRNFEGKIDEVRIWNIARSGSEIRQYMAAGLNGSESGLVAYYKMNEGLMKDTIHDLTVINGFGKLNNFDLQNSWVPGFVMDTTDVGVSAVISPASGPSFGDSRVKIRVKNFGFNSVSNIKVGYRVNGGAVVTDTLMQTILPYQTAEFTFDQLANISSGSPAQINAFTLLSTDTHRSNDTVSATVSAGTEIVAFDNVRHSLSDYGQTHYSYVTFPENIEKYDTIIMHISLACPPSGCDPWDQAGRISIIDAQGRSIELGRFITPFGMAYDGWDIDVTDFKSVLKGCVLLQSNIQVFGNSGWLLSVKFRLHEGVSAYQYSQITPLWNSDYQVYGDPTISYDLPVLQLPVKNTTSVTMMRLTTTGHGQGNTDNAAEFAEKTHKIYVNGTPAFDQHLWNDNCGENPCSPQNGTWQYARAGWCPGQDVKPFEFNLTGFAMAGSTASLDYVLQSYTNLLNTGYNGGSHTEPHLRIHAYAIEFSNAPYDSIHDAALSSIIAPQAPVTEALGNNESVTVEIQNLGHYAITNPVVSFAVNGVIKDTDTLHVTLNPGETQQHTFATTVDLSAEQALYSLSAMILSANDEVVTNDVYTRMLQNPTAIGDQQNSGPAVGLIPNPASEELSIVISNVNDEKMTGQIISLLGNVVKTFSVQNGHNRISVKDLNNGIYFVVISSSGGKTVQRLVVGQ